MKTEKVNGRRWGRQMKTGKREWEGKERKGRERRWD
jgi:hypothetical protein